MDRRNPTTSAPNESFSQLGREAHGDINTKWLADKLLRPRQNTRQLIADFGNGNTLVGDVGKMTTGRRAAILQAYREGSISDMAQEYREILSNPVANLHARVVDGPQDQLIGHNFFVNATGFLDQEHRWAQDLDSALRSKGDSLSIHTIASSQTDPAMKTKVLEKMSDGSDPQLTATLAVYLAGRSLAGEQFLEHHYGEVMKQAKIDVNKAITILAQQTELSSNMLRRAGEQLELTAFSSFDHLNGLVTSTDSGIAAKYYIGTLRMQVHFDGNVNSPNFRSKNRAYADIVHELYHATGAESYDADRNILRSGLRVNKEGVSVNEGMTEFLAQYTTGSPGIKRLPNGGLTVSSGTPYRAETLSMLSLHEEFRYGKNNHFAALFNTYHGDIQDPALLKAALDSFCQKNAFASRHLGRQV